MQVLSFFLFLTIFIFFVFSNLNCIFTTGGSSSISPVLPTSSQCNYPTQTLNQSMCQVVGTYDPFVVNNHDLNKYPNMPRVIAEPIYTICTNNVNPTSHDQESQRNYENSRSTSMPRCSSLEIEDKPPSYDRVIINSHNPQANNLNADPNASLRLSQN